jgi:SAM-dependent methyltransferase
MLLVPLAGASVDAVICMWQSFGYLDAQTNRSALVEMRRVLRPGGTLVLDLYHREFYASTEGNRIIERDGRRIHEQRAMAGNRLHVRLRYDNPDELDEFEWLLYTPTELAGVARSIGLDHVLTCTEFDERIEASAEHPRMQLVFEAQ